MSLPAWLQNEGAWIAIGVSLVFVIAALVMHRVVVNVLKAPPGAMPSTLSSSKKTTAHE
ncbi:MAG: hypothetical protein WEK74_06240 [Hydrogenophaga sp.]